MSNIASTLNTTLLGAGICAGLSFAAFFVAAFVDGTRPEEALAYGLIVRVVAAFIGALIGFVVGVGKLGCVSLRFQLWVGCNAPSVFARSSRHSRPSRISSQMARRATRASTP